MLGGGGVGEVLSSSGLSTPILVTTILASSEGAVTFGTGLGVDTGSGVALGAGSDAGREIGDGVGRGVDGAATGVARGLGLAPCVVEGGGV